MPLAIHAACHQEWLDAILAGSAQPGSIKLSRSRLGVWYALLSASMEVPDAVRREGWIGIDRGQNVAAAAALPDGGRLVFFHARQLARSRRKYAKRRKALQAQGKHRAVKKLEQRERRQVTHLNRKLSKEIVGLAERSGCGIRLEELSGIRQRRAQRKEQKSDNGQNRAYWPFYQLETFVAYKAALRGVAVEKVPAPYTSKTHHECGRLGVRRGKDFYCECCDQHEHADGNAARNIGAPWGLFCVWGPSKLPPVMDGAVPVHGVDDCPLNLVSEPNPKGLG